MPIDPQGKYGNNDHLLLNMIYYITEVANGTIHTQLVFFEFHCNLTTRSFYYFRIRRKGLYLPNEVPLNHCF
jgi:hypothetical protein